ncbi:MAG: hypothetical protein HON42_04145, partial [Alphaproteobacteria bacterium]|nr:hypothetical protein [Alphaproteobacteria bacterium]
MANVSETLNKLSTLINSEMNLESEKIETTNSDDGDILSLNDVVDSTGDDLPNDTNEFNAADELNTVDDVNDDVTLESNENISKVETNSEKITSKPINHKDNLAVEPWQKAIKQELKE